MSLLDDEGRVAPVPWVPAACHVARWYSSPPQLWCGIVALRGGTMRKHPARSSWWIGLLAGCLILGPGLVAGTVRAGAATGATLQAQGSVDEAWLTGATPGDRITLMRKGEPVINAGNPGTADSLGSLIIRNLSPGGGYSWDDISS